MNEKENYKSEIYKVCKKIGIDKYEITNIMKNRKKTVIAGALIITALAFIGNLYYMGMHYGGISIEDFGIFNRFRFLQFIFNRF